MTAERVNFKLFHNREAHRFASLLQGEQLWTAVKGKVDSIVGDGFDMYWTSNPHHGYVMTLFKPADLEYVIGRAKGYNQNPSKPPVVYLHVQTKEESAENEEAKRKADVALKAWKAEQEAKKDEEAFIAARTAQNGARKLQKEESTAEAQEVVNEVLTAPVVEKAEKEEEKKDEKEEEKSDSDFEKISSEESEEKIVDMIMTEATEEPSEQLKNVARRARSCSTSSEEEEDDSFVFTSKPEQKEEVAVDEPQLQKAPAKEVAEVEEKSDSEFEKVSSVNSEDEVTIIRGEPEQEEAVVADESQLQDAARELKIREKALEMKEAAFAEKMAEFAVKMEEMEEKMKGLEERVEELEDKNMDSGDIEWRMDEIEQRLETIEERSVGF